MDARTQGVGRILTFATVLLALASGASGQLLGAAASHDDPDGAIVLWTRAAMLVSRDGGRSFAPLALPVPNLRQVAIERGGTIVALGGTDQGEETRLARVRPDGSVVAVAVPSWISRIAAGGRVLVALMPYEPAIAISTDAGPFVVRPAPPARMDLGTCSRDPASAECAASRALSTEASLSVDRDGVAHIVDVEVSTCRNADVYEWGRVLTVHAGGTVRVARLSRPRSAPPTAVPPGPVYPTRWGPAARGWVYALADDGRVAVLERGRARILDGPRGESMSGGLPLPLATNGVRTLAQVGGALVRLDGARVRRLAGVPAEARLVDVDARGRAIAISDAGLHRYSQRDGWALLWAAP